MEIDSLIKEAYLKATKEDYSRAKNLYLKILNQIPGHFESLLNLTLLLVRQKKYTQALIYAEKASLLSPNNEEILVLLGTIHVNIGNYSKCLSYSRIFPKHRIAQIHNIIYSLFNLRKYDQLIEFLNKEPIPPELITITNVYKGLLYFSTGRFEECKSCLSKIENIKLYNSPNEKTYKIFAVLLFDILTFYETNKSLYEENSHKKLYLIGDSHCLSPGFLTAQIGDTKYQCIPRFVQATQARHLNLLSKSRHTSTFEEAIKDIEPNSLVVLMFGEIDTRANTGILAYHKKNKNLNKKSINLTIKNIVKNYVNFCIKKTKAKNLNVIFYGIPISKLFKDISNKDKVWQNCIIETLNKELAKEVRKRNIPFIDVYKMSALENYHMDDIHLTPIAFNMACMNFMV